MRRQVAMAEVAKSGWSTVWRSGLVRSEHVTLGWTRPASDPWRCAVLNWPTCAGSTNKSCATTMPGRSYTPQQRETFHPARREQVEQLHELLAERVGSLDNRAEWETYLRFAPGVYQLLVSELARHHGATPGRHRGRRLPGRPGQGLPDP